jgi:hypothetical protein
MRGKPMINYLLLFAAYAASIAVAELTLGNKHFPFHLWVYEEVSPITWSLPIHLVGFFWIIIWNYLLRNKTFILAVLTGMLFFAVAEWVNYSYLHWFEYTGGSLGRPGALILILLLYLILCTCTIYILRKYLTVKLIDLI